MDRSRSDAEIVACLQAIESEGSKRGAARKLGIDPTQVRAMIEQAKARGLTAATVVKDPMVKLRAENAALKQQVAQLEREEETAAHIRETIYKIAAYDPDPPKWLVENGKNGFRGMPTLFASDWHYGEVVRKNQVGGVNEFNAEIAKKRIERLGTRTVDLCFNHMGKAATVYPGIVLALGGDMISGDIHEELMATNDRTPVQCVNEVTDQIAALIELFATKFGRVFVPAVPGNHGRTTRKPRLKGRAFTSYEWNIYCNLEREFKRSKNISFLIPEGADARYSVYGHRYLLTHGDNLGVKGGDGIIGALGPIRRGEIKMRNAESQIGRDFDTMVIGHWHQYLPLPGLIVNNCLKGFDEYAHLVLRAPPSRPSQALWFTHPEHGITAHWQVYVDGKKKQAEQMKPLTWEAVQ
jgi:transposase-like protein